MGIVHVLEPVEVDENDRERRAEALCASRLSLKGIGTGATVGQTREAVDERLPLDHPMQASVLERHDGLRRKQRGVQPLLLGE